MDSDKHPASHDREDSGSMATPGEFPLAVAHAPAAMAPSMSPGQGNAASIEVEAGLSALDEAIVSGLALGWPYERCAEALDNRVSARTIRRKMADPAFRAAVDDRQAELW